MTSPFQKFRDAAQIDICDLNYVFVSEKWDYMGRSSAAVLPRRGLLVRCLAYFYRLIKSVHFRYSSRLEHPGAIVLFCVSHNQDVALEPLARSLKDAVKVGDPAWSLFGPSQLAARFTALLFLPCLIKVWAGSGSYWRRSARYFIDDYLYTYGYYLACRSFCRKNRPRVVISANDHSMKNRAMLKAASDEGIRTVYIQHASVINHQPSMLCDYAFLEGVDALEKYQEAQGDADVFLVGMPKADHYMPVSFEERIHEHIGICTSDQSPVPTVVTLIEQLSRVCPELKITVRPHPGEVDSFSIWEQWCHTLGCEYSSPREEHAFEFIKKQSVVIAGDSSILLESVLMNIPAIYYYFDPAQRDIYEYVKHELCPACDTVSGLAELIGQRHQIPDWRAKARRYCHNINTVHDGHSTKLVCRLLNSLLANESIPPAGWRPFQWKGSRAFEPET
jgi:hypothetical protein